ncbi:Hypothetical_protein [Hexamita inflata]|uniref:Hypothetical_protein n=1 Tax=Hexamita inflata TaxID=28002 RepID=A0AA86PX36_9EUKA|nr:Hypothetical protein HINF_LOCUS34091 [Hexamita inflata]
MKQSSKYNIPQVLANISPKTSTTLFSELKIKQELVFNSRNSEVELIDVRKRLLGFKNDLQKEIGFCVQLFEQINAIEENMIIGQKHRQTQKYDVKLYIIIDSTMHIVAQRYRVLNTQYLQSYCKVERKLYSTFEYFYSNYLYYSTISFILTYWLENFQLRKEKKCKKVTQFTV